MCDKISMYAREKNGKFFLENISACSNIWVVLSIQTYIVQILTT